MKIDDKQGLATSLRQIERLSDAICAIEDVMSDASKGAVSAMTAAYRDEIAVIQGEIAEYNKIVLEPGNASLSLKKGDAARHRAPMRVIENLLKKLRMTIQHRGRKIAKEKGLKKTWQPSMVNIVAFAPSSFEICLELTDVAPPHQEEFDVSTPLSLEAFIAMLDTLEAVLDDRIDQIDDEDLLDDVIDIVEIVDDAGFDMSLSRREDGRAIRTVAVNEHFLENAEKFLKREDVTKHEELVGELTLVDLERMEIGITPEGQNRIKCSFTEESGFETNMLGKRVQITGDVIYSIKTGRPRKVAVNTIRLVGD
jgi:hypothetical protein